MVTRLRTNDLDQPLLHAIQTILATAAPTDFSEVLATLFAELDGGAEVLCGTADSTLTPTEAAEFLAVSRPFVYRLLDKGVLPFHAVGRDRRIPVADVLSYAARRDAGRREIAETFSSAESDRLAILRDLAGLAD